MYGRGIYNVRDPSVDITRRVVAVNQSTQSSTGLRGEDFMAATIARAIGYDSTRTKETHRLGSQSAFAEAATYHTFARAYVAWDGSGYIEVERDGHRLMRFDFSAERHTCADA